MIVSPPSNSGDGNSPTVPEATVGVYPDQLLDSYLGDFESTGTRGIVNRTVSRILVVFSTSTAVAFAHRYRSS